MPWISDEEYLRLKEEKNKKSELEQFVDDWELFAECAYWPMIVGCLLFALFLMRDSIFHWLGWY